MLPQDQHVCLGPGVELRPVSTLLGPRLGNQRVVLEAQKVTRKGYMENVFEEIMAGSFPSLADANIQFKKLSELQVGQTVESMHRRVITKLGKEKAFSEQSQSSRTWVSDCCARQNPWATRKLCHISNALQVKSNQP